MFEYTNRMKLPLLVPNQSKKEITHNEALIVIDNLLQNHIISKNLSAPPLEPNTGDMYIVAIDGQEKWLNKENQLAIFDNGWRFVEPIYGMLFYILDENCFYVYKNGWIKLENLIDFKKLQNINIDNLQENEIIKYDGNNFINSREINLLKLYINDKLFIDENLNVGIKNNEDLINIMSITADNIDFKTNIKIAGIIIDEYILNIVDDKIKEETQKQEEIINEKFNDFVNDMVIDTIQSYNLPDYNSMIGITQAQFMSGYRAPSNGFMLIKGQSSTSGNFRISVNGKNIYYIAAGVLNQSNFLVNKDDLIKFNEYLNQFINAYFIPLKTAIINDNNEGE